MRILVTGGAGYLGSHLVSALLANNHSVTVIDNFMYQQQSLAGVCMHKDFHLIRGDVLNEGLIEAALDEHDIAIPLAAIVGAPACDANPYTATQINSMAVKKLAEAAGGKLVIYPNTNSGYGATQPGQFATEDSPLNPVSIYGTTKCAAEKVVLAHGGISLRFATLFGMSPRMRLDLLVNDFVHRALTERVLVLFEAHYRRNYLHVRDAARAFVFAINNQAQMRGKAYNVGLSHANLTKAELAMAIATMVPGLQVIESPSGKDPDQRDYFVSNDRIERIGFRPQFSLADGITELIKGYKMLPRREFANA